MARVYICNAFSLQMIEDFPCSIEVCEFPEHMKTIEEIKTLFDNEAEFISAVGHPDTAAVLGVPCNRINVKVTAKDYLIVAQLQGGRLPEGSTTLPDGFSFKFLFVKVIKGKMASR